MLQVIHDRAYRDHVLRLRQQECDADILVARARKAGDAPAVEHWLCVFARATYERKALMGSKSHA